ncbi:MAG: universal stress protein [Hyphomicrobiales bacterium]
MFETIVVAVDGSAPSENALLTACNIAKKFGSKIYLVHSPELDTVGLAMGSGAFSIEPSATRIKFSGNVIMDKAKEIIQHQGCNPTESVIRNGAPADEVLKLAQKINADLIVTGRRGLGNLVDLFMGSVSQKIAQEAKCACLTVK